MTEPGIEQITDSFYDEDISLSESEIERLLGEFSPDVRSDVASRIAGVYGMGDLSEEDFRLAEQIFTVLVNDASSRVRKSLSESLKESDIIAHDIVFALAHDEEVVAKPIIHSSHILTDADLIQIIQTGKTYLQKLVAGRPEISEDVSGAVVDTEKAEVVEVLAENISADISDASLTKIFEVFPREDNLLKTLIDNHELPPVVVEKAVTVATSSIAKNIAEKYEVSGDKAYVIERTARERTTIDIIQNPANKEEIIRLVAELETNFKLTHSIILTALCKGNLLFFEAALARLANISSKNAHMLLTDATGRGFQALYVKAGLPVKTQYAAKLAFNTASALIRAGANPVDGAFRKDMLRELEKNIDIDNMQQMIDFVKS